MNMRKGSLCTATIVAARKETGIELLLLPAHNATAAAFQNSP
jgi:hypothetical protein